jgi:hypothetical protein
VPDIGYSAISLISYDYQFLLQSLPHYVNDVDEVILGLDKYRQTWSGNSFSIPDSFFLQLSALDPEKKIRILEDNFYIPDFTPIQNDTRERNFLTNFVKPGNWMISIDADEVLVSAQLLKEFLANLSDPDVCVLVPVVTIFKRLADSSLLIARTREGGDPSYLPVATRSPNSFIGARYTAQRQALCSAKILHYSWARSDDDLYMKLKNWGHSTHFDVESYFSLWQAIDGKNYRYLRNFHPIWPNEWVELIKISEEDIGEFGSRTGVTAQIIEVID